MTIHYLRPVRPPANATPEEDEAYYRRVLFELDQMGAELARRLPQKTPPPVKSGRTAARRRIIRAVEDAIWRSDSDDGDELHEEFLDRLDKLEFEDDEHIPVAEIIGDICRDLGLREVPGTRRGHRRVPKGTASIVAGTTKQPAAVTVRPLPTGPRKK